MFGGKVDDLTIFFNLKDTFKDHNAYDASTLRIFLSDFCFNSYHILCNLRHISLNVPIFLRCRSDKKFAHHLI